ncbi:hypothetical protein HHE02_11350 [Helicobacter heilmannii]|nr:hypothetical protein HHE02_11350 [Helicobacter heilmannii]CRF51502.1 hypothetical protein HHE06_13860 [Helicobacter heilmannii]
MARPHHIAPLERPKNFTFTRHSQYNIPEQNGYKRAKPC